MKRNASQSGQATTEMVFMLLGFAVLLLGLVFTLSLEIFNTRTLLDSKYETERAVNKIHSSTLIGTGQEIRGWEYANGIPFTLSDQAVYRSGGEVSQAYVNMDTPVDSNAQHYTYEWVKLGEFPNGKFTADYREREQNAMSAAHLITFKGDPQGRLLTAKFPELYTAFANLLGLKVDHDNLRNNPSNRVFLPANGEL